MSACRYCGKTVSRRFGHLARHEAGCSANPQPHTEPLKAEPAKDEAPPPRWRHRAQMGGAAIWVRR